MLKLMESLDYELCDGGLEVNADKSTLYALEIEYLGYVLTKDRIKLHNNKVQAIQPINK